MLWGLYTLGFDEEANDFFYFIRDVAAKTNDELQIMYGIGGEETLTEEMLLHLDGYEHAQPVRVGNGAFAQKQHDVWGALLDSIYLHTKSRDGLAESTWEILCKQVEHAIAAWREPDRGIWEVRGAPQHFTSSKVMCWVACDRGARLARLREDHERSDRWQEAADEIHADICEHGIDGRGVFRPHYDTAALDASCLLIPLVRFLPPDDERVIATVNAIADELTSTAWCSATTSSRPTTACRETRAPSPSARSGWSAPWPRSASTIAPARCARRCSASPRA